MHRTHNVMSSKTTIKWRTLIVATLIAATQGAVAGAVLTLLEGDAGGFVLWTVPLGASVGSVAGVVAFVTGVAVLLAGRSLRKVLR